jgi:hypothetical protein
MDWYNWDYCKLEEIVGKTPVSIDNTGDEIHFHMSDGSHYVMLHRYDCCESVTVEDIAGDLNDLLNQPITLAESRSNYKQNRYGDQRWTFYELQGPGGYATIRWYGTSNGYYGTGVDFMRADKPKVENNPAF